MKELYGCLSLKESITVEVMGTKRELELSWDDGMIGVMPVFGSKKEALEYVNGNQSRIFPLKVTKEGVKG